MEPWLSGTITGIHPVLAAVLYSFQHARQDLDQWTRGFSDEQMWRKVGDVAPVGFHIRHIAGSVNRLITYANNGSLDETQLKEMRSDQETKGQGREELFALLDRKLAHATEIVRGIDPSTLGDIREIGRKRVPVPLAVLLVHISEHTQRHVGEAIVTAKIVRA
jgi:DinB family protein